MEALTNFFLDKNCENILDVGTGSGKFLPILKDAFPGSKIVGIDPLTESLEEAKNNYPDVQFIQGQAERLPYKAETFDVVSISFALHHLAKVSKGLREMKRVVKKDGWIIVNEIISDNLNPSQEVHKMYHHFRSRIDRMLGVSHHETFKKGQIIQMVEDAGISIQFFFDSNDEPIIKGNDEIKKRADVMKKMLGKIKGKPEYDGLQDQLSEFKKLAKIHGIQQASTVIIVGRKMR